MYNNSVCKIKNIIYYKEMLLHSVTRSFCNMRWNNGPSGCCRRDSD